MMNMKFEFKKSKKKIFFLHPTCKFFEIKLFHIVRLLRKLECGLIRPWKTDLMFMCLTLTIDQNSGLCIVPSSDFVLFLCICADVSSRSVSRRTVASGRVPSTTLPEDQKTLSAPAQTSLAEKVDDYNYKSKACVIV